MAIGIHFPIQTAFFDVFYQTSWQVVRFCYNPHLPLGSELDKTDSPRFSAGIALRSGTVFAKINQE